ncbi:prepilin peptidase [Specibacter sp. NPDC057265]|uniref:prepilin peptidase n=1 Tax=Specibacter sp. NPDC057265 TaxID=3346075 RepID=UPI00362FD548
MVTRLAQLWEESTLALLCAVAACGYFLWLALVLSVIDIRTHRLPDRLVLPAYPLAGVLLLAAALAAKEPHHALNAAGGALALGALYWLLWALYPQGMGFGDVKLAGVLGLYLGFLGWSHVLWGAAAGFVAGGLWGVAVMASGRGTAKTAIPFGPAMLVGAGMVMALLPAPG